MRQVLFLLSAWLLDKLIVYWLFVRLQIEVPDWARANVKLALYYLNLL